MGRRLRPSACCSQRHVGTHAEFQVRNREVQREWRRRNKEKLAADRRAWYVANIEREQARGRALYRKNGHKWRPWRALVVPGSVCSKCGFVPQDLCQLEVDHINGDRSDNRPGNWQVLCCNCHRLKSKLCGDFGCGRPTKEL